MSALPSEPSAPPAPPLVTSDGRELSALRLILLGMGAVIALGALAYIATLGPWSHGSAPKTEAPALTAEPAPTPAVALTATAAGAAEAIGQPAQPVAPRAIEVKEVAAAPAQHHDDVAPVPVPVPVTAPAPPPLPAAHGLSSEALAGVLTAAQGELQRCYEQAMVAALTGGQPALPVLAFEVSLRVSPEGRVERAQVTTTQREAPPPLRACLQGVIDGLRFPAAGAASEARFPIVFQPAVVGP